MEGFIGRQTELQLLEDAWRGSKSAFIPIYGRRRVGKSELILHFLKGKRGLYFLGKQAPAPLQMHEFLVEAARAADEPLLASFVATDWKAALIAVTERVREKLVLVFDEFQWTVEASPELPSVLQELWDRSWRSGGRIVLILCGSYVGFMERDILGRKSPLFGRRTAQILLRPFGYLEAAQFHPRLSLVDRARIRFICGGIPLYLQYFSPDRSVEQNIARVVLDEHGPLFREPDFLLREELREVEKYYAILMAIASGQATNQAISSQTGIDVRSLHYYLKQLTELGYVAQRHPLTGRPAVARHVRYSLEDALLRFWFRFVYPNYSFIASMGPERALKDRIRPHLEAFYGLGFERLCREALPVLYQREGVTAAFEVGEYWDKSTQIDVVGWRDDGWIDLGECKWGTVRSLRGVADEIEDRVACYPNPRNATVCRRIFTRQAASGSGNFRHHTLADLYDNHFDASTKSE